MSTQSVRPPSLSQYSSYLAAQLVKGAQRLLLDRLADRGLRLHHFAVLAATSDVGSPCQQDLCDALDIDKSHMVTFVDDLTDAGLLTKERDLDDRRRHRLAITRAGQETLQDLHRAERDCQEVLFGHLDAHQRTVFHDTLAMVVERLDVQRLQPGVANDGDAGEDAREIASGTTGAAASA